MLDFHVTIDSRTVYKAGDMKEAVNRPDRPDPDNRLLEHLLHRLADGETEALEPLFQATRAAVFALALSLVHQYQDAEDITHDTYVSVYHAASRYEARGKPLAWIFTITKNLALMKLRNKNRHVSLDEIDQARLVADMPTLTLEDRLVLRTYLEELSENEQMLVVLHAVAGWKHREVAVFMKMSTPHVIVTYNRAIRKLVRKYQQDRDQDDRENNINRHVIF